MNTIVTNPDGLHLPKHDTEDFTYIGGTPSDNDALTSTIVCKWGGTTVATMTFTYVGSTNNVDSLVVTYP